MQTYYKSVRLVDGKPRWVVTDEYDNIVDKNPTKELLKSAAIIDGRKRTRFSVPFKERKCCICGKEETYVTNSGSSQWFDHICNKIDCTKCLCKKCYSRGYYEDSRYYVINGPDSNNYIIKLMRPCRSDDIYSKKFSELNNQQIGRIGEDIVTATLGLKNWNDLSNNYSSTFDLIDLQRNDKIQVEVRRIDIIEKKWHCAIRGEFNKFIALCMDRHEPWKKIERMYVIPHTYIYHLRSISMYEDLSRGSKWEKFRIDESPFNNTYQEMRKIYRVLKEY